MKNVYRRKFLFVLLAVGLASPALGCGANNSAVLPPIGSVLPYNPYGTVCGTGINFGGTCAVGSIQQLCYEAGGQMDPTGTVCRYQMSLNYNSGFGYVAPPENGFYVFESSGILPVINPQGTNPYYPTANISQAFNTGIPVMAGDSVVVSTSGGWGVQSLSFSSYFDFVCGGVAGCGFGFGGGTINSCSEISTVGGYSSYTVPYAGNGAPAGLYGSDGIGTFPVGNGTAITIQNNGQLFLGFNAPAGVIPNVCSQFKISQLIVTRCEDGYGNIYPCQ